MRCNHFEFCEVVHADSDYFPHMMQQWRPFAAGSFVEPDDVVFAVLIRGYGLASNPPDWTAVARLLSRMQTEFDVQMTINVYNALLELCASSNDLVRAEELLDKMETMGIMPDEFTSRAVEGKRALRSALKRTFKDVL